MESKNQLAMHIKKKRETEVSLKSINFALLMYKQLISEQRYTIFILFQQGIEKRYSCSYKCSSINYSREIKRNSGKRGIYNWKRAQSNSIYRKRRNPGNRTINKEIMSRVIDLLVTEQWSPKQISETLALEGISISHET
jgi:IS30 family transposase